MLARIAAAALAAIVPLTIAVAAPAEAASRGYGTFTTGRGDRAVVWQYTAATWPVQVPDPRNTYKTVNGWATFVSLVPKSKGKRAVPPCGYQIDAWDEQAKHVLGVGGSARSVGAAKWQVARVVTTVRPHDVVHVRWVVSPVCDETVNPIRNVVLNERHKTANLRPVYLAKRPAGL